ncbi:hypothetical protein [Streptomyces sp. NPDC059209]|uniref:hypothetical protein n=1 Tax=Streptomyces sp. NPDC059209 TaxID=3346769 RepID=UPI0036776232
MFKRGSVAVVVAGLVLAIGGCGGETDEKAGGSDKKTAEPTPTRPPSKKLVSWVGGMCGATTAIKDFRTRSAEDLKEIRNPGEDSSPPKLLAMNYLVGAPLEVDGAESALEDLGPSGVPAADRMVDAWLKKVRSVAAELDGVSPDDASDDAEGSAAGVDKLVQTLVSPKPDLVALTKKDPQLAGAYKRAERCAKGSTPDEETALVASTGPLPKAADGRNTDACSDGECEVLVTSDVDITANGVGLRVATGKGSVTMYAPSSVMTLGGRSSMAVFGDDLAVIVVGLDKDGAVLKFTTP